MAYNVIVTDGKTTVIAACVDALGEATSTALQFERSKPFLQRVMLACEDKGIDDTMRQRRYNWYRLLTKARKLGLGKGIIIEQV